MTKEGGPSSCRGTMLRGRCSLAAGLEFFAGIRSRRRLR